MLKVHSIFAIFCLMLVTDSAAAMPNLRSEFSSVTTGILKAFNSKSTVFLSGTVTGSEQICQIEIFTNGPGHLSVRLTKHDGIKEGFLLNPSGLQVVSRFERGGSEYNNLESISYTKEAVSLTTNEGSFGRGVISFSEEKDGRLVLALSQIYMGVTREEISCSASSVQAK